MTQPKYIMFLKVFILSALVLIVTSYVVRDDETVNGDVAVEAPKKEDSTKDSLEEIGKPMMSDGCLNDKFESGVILKDRVRVDCLKIDANNICYLAYSKPSTIQFTFNATKEISESDFITIEFCGGMFGTCLKDPTIAKQVNLCGTQLTCPLKEGNEYTVSIKKTIPNLFFTMSIRAEIRLNLRKKEMGCIAMPLLLS